MAIDIDGYSVLRAISAKPEVFSDIKSEVAKTARALMTKQLKAASLTLEKVRKIHAALEQGQFSNIIDGLKANEIKALLKRIDKHNVDVAQHSEDKNRKLLIDLANASAEPSQRAAPPPRAAKTTKASSKKKVTRAISSEAMAARWDGTNPDDPKN